jgi:hypothetical protein
MQIRAWKHEIAATYLVQVGDDMYEMSGDADMPNGVCIYIGTFGDTPVPPIYRGWQHGTAYCWNVPIGIVRQIVELNRNGGAS